MPDRIDRSQYPAAWDFREARGFNEPDGSLQPYAQEEAEYADADALTNWYPRHPMDVPDPALQNPAITKSTAPLRHDIRYRPVQGSGVIANGKARFAGLSLRETTGTASAVVRIRDGVDTQGSIVIPLSLAANESARDYLAVESAIRFNTGIFIEVVSGSVEGTVLIVGDYRE